MMLIILENESKPIILDENHSYHKHEVLNFYYDGSGFIVLDNGFRFKDGSTRKTLKAGAYEVTKIASYRFYVYEEIEGFYEYHLYKKKDFLLAFDKRSNITTSDQNLRKHYLYYHEGKLETSAPFLLVNGSEYDGQELKDGDEVAFLGFRMVCGKNFLYINSFKSTIKLESFVPEGRSLNFERYIPANADVHFFNDYQLEPLNYEKYRKPEPPNERNVWLQMGPGLMMSVAMVSVSGFNAYESYLKGDDTRRTLIYLIMPLTMFISTLLWPSLNRLYEKVVYKRQCEKAKNSYLTKFNELTQEYEKKIQNYLKAKNELYFKGIDENCFALSPVSPHFLKISIGFTGLDIEVNRYESGDRDIDEVIGRYLYHLQDIKNDPYFVDLKEAKRVTIITSKKDKKTRFLRFLLELAYKHHPDDLQLSVFCKDEEILSIIHALPHLFSADERFCFKKPSELERLTKNADKPRVLLVYDEIKTQLPDDLRVLYFSASQRDYLKNSDVVVDYRKGKIISEHNRPFTFETETEVKREEFALLGAAQHFKEHRHFSFKDSNSEPEISARYGCHDNHLIANFAYGDERYLPFDLHEHGNGPHGLIAGSTGSGKSELIISLIIGLCANYGPDYLNIILIDYKGGGLSESLSYDNELLPHITASITSLQEDTFERLITLIRKECRRRQTLFHELSLKRALSIMNIDDYNIHDPEKYSLKRMAHLVIVIDEFAEMKKENPEVIRELISFARIGRSLGLHLILATQRPSGVIDDEIWSNSRFKLALKVFSEKDSQDVLHSRVAAYLKDPGSFYMACDGQLSKAQSIYSKRSIFDNETLRVGILKYDLSLADQYSHVKTGGISECEYLCKSIIKVSKELGLKAQTLNYRCPDPLDQNELIDKYRNDITGNELIYGEIDDYLQAEVYPARIDASDDLLVVSPHNELSRFFELLKNKTKVIISQDKIADFDDSFAYSDKRGIEHLFYCLNKTSKEIYVLIEDVATFIAYDPLYLENLLKLMSRKPDLHMWIISKRLDLNYRFVSSFKQRILIASADKQDQLSLFGRCSAYKGTSFFMKGDIYPLTPFVSSLIRPKNNEQAVTVQMSANAEAYSDGERIMIAYSVLSRKKVYLSKEEKIIVASYKEEDLNLPCLKYPNIEMCVYTNNACSKKADVYIWIGEGLSSQRLFFCEKRIELFEGEAYLYKHGKGEVVKLVECQ